MDNKNGRHGKVWRPSPFSGCSGAYILIGDLLNASRTETTVCCDCRTYMA